MNRGLIAAASTVIVATSLCELVLAQAAIPSEAQLVSRLTGGPQPERAATVAYIETMPPDQISGALSKALCMELDRLNADRRMRRVLVRNGTALDDFEGEYYLSLIRVIAGRRHPDSISSLLGAVDSGLAVSSALATFKPDDVVPLLLGVVETRSKGPEGPSADEVVGALQTLTLIMNSRQRSTMSDQLERRVRQVTRTRLRGLQVERDLDHDPSADVAGIVLHACLLAAATGDVELADRVKELAENRKELAALGITQGRAADLAQLGCRTAWARIR